MLLFGDRYSGCKLGALRKILMPKVSLDTPAPDFTLIDFKGQPVSLAGFRGKAHVVLVFNRGFF